MKGNKINLLIGLTMIGLAVCYSLYTKYQRDKQGLITAARIDKFEAAEQGGDLYITIFFRGRQYPAIVNALCTSCSRRKLYFVKIFPNDPAGNPLFFEDKPVPDCISSREKYFGGWKAFPSCE